MLEPNAGCGDDPCEEVIVSAREADKLVANAHNEGEGDQTDTGSGNDIEDLMVDKRCGDEHIDNNRNEKHKDKEGGAAAGVESLLLTDVLDGQLKSLLIAENCFMFGSVICKKALYITETAAKTHVKKQNDNSQM